MRPITIRSWSALAAGAWLQLAAAEPAPALSDVSAPLLLAAVPAAMAPAPSAASAAPAASAPAPASAPHPGTDSAIKFGVPAAVEQLAQMRGGSDTVWNDMQLSGTVAGNAASHVVSGANIVSDGAFSNASGLPMVIQNSGANVLIQNATIINVHLK